MTSGSAVVVLSGGQDSTTALFWAKGLFDELYAITFDYGQRHSIEVDAAMKVAKLAGVAKHEVIDCAGLLCSASPLTSSAPLEKYADYKQMDKVIGKRVEVTFVPMRNTFFLTLAMNRAVAWGARRVVLGICQEDNANYPDCTERFRGSFETMTNISLGRRLLAERICLLAPLMHMSKAQTCQLAHSMPDCWEALAYTHTSYDGRYPPTDMNHANVLRAHGFEQAGLPDPLVLRAVREGLMELPNTDNYSDFVVARG